MRSLIRSQFLRYLEGHGFEEDDGREQIFGYRRRLADRHDLVEVQFDRCQRPKFILNFGKVDGNGLIDAYGRHVEAENTKIFLLVEQGRLNAFSKPEFLEHWFGPRWWSVGSTEVMAVAAVQRLIQLFPQVDNWLVDGRLGPNLRIRHSPHNASGTAKRALEAKGLWPPEGWTAEDERSLRM